MIKNIQALMEELYEDIEKVQYEVQMMTERTMQTLREQNTDATLKILEIKKKIQKIQEES